MEVYSQVNNSMTRRALHVGSKLEPIAILELVVAQRDVMRRSLP